MIKAIPDANQTFREITFDVVTKKVENDIQPRVFFEDFPGWVLYVRDDPPDRRRLEGRPGRQHQQAGRDRPLFRRARPARGQPRGARVDLVLTERHTGIRRASPGETQHLHASRRPDRWR